MPAIQQRRSELLEANKRLGLSKTHALLLTREVESVLDQYGASRQSKSARPADVRKELKRLLELAEQAKHRKSLSAARVMERYAQNMSAKAWAYCSSEKESVESPLNRALRLSSIPKFQSVAQRGDYSERAIAVTRIVSEALSLLPQDPGGRPRDMRTRRFVCALICLFEKYTERQATLRTSGVANRGSFTEFLLTVIDHAYPPLSTAKAFDYAKETLSYGQRGAKAKFMSPEDVKQFFVSPTEIGIPRSYR